MAGDVVGVAAHADGALDQIRPARAIDSKNRWVTRIGNHDEERGVHAVAVTICVVVSARVQILTFLMAAFADPPDPGEPIPIVVNSQLPSNVSGFDADSAPFLA